jgi:beta-lactamase regulating signal transducer with metallopeptidase domain
MRVAIVSLALFFSAAPSFALAQATGTTGAAGSSSNSAPSSSNSVTSQTSTTTGSTTTANGTMPSGVNWTWLVVGAVVLVVVIGLIAMTNGRTRTSTTVRRD